MEAEGVYMLATDIACNQEGSRLGSRTCVGRPDSKMRRII